MDSTQFLLSTAVTITTVLLILVGLQLISLLKQFKKDGYKEISHSMKKPGDPSAGGKKDKTAKKRINLVTLLEKMRLHISHPQTSKKKFFKS